ncbi:OsmC family protein [uncultured Roseovarius sp.]|uniref:OsmC family protein n=1 Tax=uncultured Roseovarius sp. TaxID=293344 RepID=UPI00261614F4|nr:OsmC family protein [uncultured Roseovarius sp.]
MRNGIDLEGLGAARDAISETPSAGIATYGVDLTWHQGVKIEAQATGIIVGQESIPRNFKWTVDEPPQLLGESSGPTPQEYLMSGVGACIMVGFVVNASVKGIDLRSLKIRMSGGLDLAGFLNLREDAEVKMQGLDYEIEVDCDASAEALEEVADAALNFSPNAMTVKNGIPISGRLKVMATG